MEPFPDPIQIDSVSSDGALPRGVLLSSRPLSVVRSMLPASFELLAIHAREPLN
jgi:hypothetical protein